MPVPMVMLVVVVVMIVALAVAVAVPVVIPVAVAVSSAVPVAVAVSPATPVAVAVVAQQAQHDEVHEQAQGGGDQHDEAVDLLVPGDEPLGCLVDQPERERKAATWGCQTTGTMREWPWIG